MPDRGIAVMVWSTSTSISVSHHITYFFTGPELDGQLSHWLDQVKPSIDYSPPIERCKAVIAPHAGYSYSGPAAAWAYKGINTTGMYVAFIIEPVLC